LSETSVKVGNFVVPVTPSLRELFSHTHDMMSGAQPADKQFPHDEQYEMYLICEVAHKADKNQIDVEKTEDNLLEMIHYLNEQGVDVPEIIGTARCFSPRTRSVAVRLHLKEVRARHASEQAELHFMAPSLVGAAT
jgi:hypothetical protein